MKPVTRPVVFCALFCTASLAGAQTPEGRVLAIDEGQGDQYGWAVDYETVGTAGQRVLETNTAPASHAAGGTGNAQLPPEILLDRHLLRAERLLADGEPAAALEAMNEVLALQEEHDLVLEDDFDFRYAQVAHAAGRIQTAIASLNAYLVAAGREGEFYRAALELLDSAEVRLEREEAERRRAEAERRRAARWPPGHLFRDCKTCPEMVVLPGSVLALGRYEVTVGEWRAFAMATRGGPGSGCSNVLSEDDDDDRSWRNPGFPQTDRHPVACASWGDAQAYVSWLSRQTGATYRLPGEAEWERAAAGSQPGCDRLGRGARPDGTCPVGSNGSTAAGVSDMVGNVWEWTSDCWEGDCGRRVVRGGAWDSRAVLVRQGARLGGTTVVRNVTVGFRVSRTLD